MLLRHMLTLLASAGETVACLGISESCRTSPSFQGTSRFPVGTPCDLPICGEMGKMFTACVSGGIYGEGPKLVDILKTQYIGRCGVDAGAATTEKWTPQDHVPSNHYTCVHVGDIVYLLT